MRCTVTQETSTNMVLLSIEYELCKNFYDSIITVFAKLKAVNFF